MKEKMALKRQKIILLFINTIAWLGKTVEWALLKKMELPRCFQAESPSWWDDRHSAVFYPSNTIAAIILRWCLLLFELPNPHPNFLYYYHLIFLKYYVIMSTLLEAFPLPPGESKITYSRGSNPPQPSTMFSFQTLSSHTDCMPQLTELFVLSRFWLSHTLFPLLSVFFALNQYTHAVIPQRYVP